jgi:putative ABC transport system permease protein
MPLVLKSLLSYHWRNWGQSLFLLAGLVAGLTLWVAVQVINDTAKTSYRQANKLLDYQVTHLIISSDASQAVPQEEYVRLRRAGYGNLVPVIERRLRDDQGRLLDVLATDLFAISGGDSESNEDRSNSFDPANIGESFSGKAWLQFIQPPFATYIPSVLANSLSIGDGDQLVTREGLLLPPSKIIIGQQGSSKLLLDIGAAMAMFEQDGFDYIAVTSNDQQQTDSLVAAVQSSTFRNLQIITNTQALDLTQLTESFHINLTAMSLLSLAVGLFIIYNAAQFSVLYRRASIKILRSCGVSLSELGVGLAIEYIGWVLIGTIIGCSLGYILGSSLLPSVSATLNGLYGASVSAGVSFNIDWLWQTFLIALAGMGLAVVVPMCSLLSTASVSRTFEVVDKQTVSRNWKAIIVIAIFIALAGVLLSGVFLSKEYALIGAFVGLALLILAGALTLSKLLMLFVLLGKRYLPKKNYMTRWVLSDIELQLPRTRIAFMAILLALVANIGVNLMVNSFRSAFNDWIDYRLAADIYMVGELNQSAGISELAGIGAISESAEQSVRWKGHNVSLRGIDRYDPAFTDIAGLSRLVAERGGLSSIAEIQQKWLTGSGVLINEQMRHKQGVSPGALVTLDTPGGARAFEVLATLHDYGNTEFQIYFPLTSLRDYWPESQSTGWALMLDGTKSELSIIEQLEYLGVPAERIRPQAEIKRVASRVFERTFMVTAALNSLTLLIAGVSMLCALLALQIERAGFIGNLLSMGLHRSELIFGMLGALLFKFVITFTLAVPLGYTLAWVLIEKINILSFGWTMPLLWHVQSIVNTGAIASLVLVFSAIPVLWLVKRKPLRHWLALARYSA